MHLFGIGKYSSFSFISFHFFIGGHFTLQNHILRNKYFSMDFEINMGYKITFIFAILGSTEMVQAFLEKGETCLFI